MKIVIVGGGKVGAALCIDLAAEDHDIVVIDEDARVVDNLLSLADINGVVGNGASLVLQREAGVASCDVFIAVTSSDEVNIIAAVIAQKLGAKATMVRVRNPEYTSNLSFFQKSLGVSMIVNPEYEAARAIALSIRFPSALNVEMFANGRIQMVEVRVNESSVLAGMRLNKFREKYGKVLVCVVQRDEHVYIPGGDFILQKGDLLHVTGPINDLTVIYKAAGCLTRKIHSVMIIGGNLITRYLLQIIERWGRDICVIEKDEAKTELLSAEFPRVKVITGDGTDQDVLTEQHIRDFDCFVAMTGIDEENLITSWYAAKQNVPKIVTKINRKPLLRMVKDLGLQSTVVTPKRLASDQIARFVRALNEKLESKVEAMYRIIDGRVEALQFIVLKKSFATGIPLKDLRLKKNVLIVYIIRDNQLIFPTGDDEIRPGDHLIAVTTMHVVDEVDDLLEDEARK